MRALDRKLWRDLWHLRGQAFAIALVIAGGVATYVMAASTLHSLQLTRASFYREYRFGDVFATLKRAPERLQARIASIPGVERVETRVLAAVNLDIPGYADPASGLLISVPDHGAPLLNDLYLRRGRTVDPQRDDEVMVAEAFALAHGFQLGDHVYATINGRRKGLTIVGVVLSPEYVYQIRPGEIIPDFEGYGVLWMARTPLATAYDMDGAFNAVSLTLRVDAGLPDVLARLDTLLEPFGGLGAYARADQISHRFLNEEFRQLKQMAKIYPFIFLGVSAFLLNVVVTRLVSTQRDQIAVLKAFGYANLAVGWHYAKLTLAIVFLGAGLGVLIGARFGRAMSDMYQQFYRFPFLRYELELRVAIVAVAIGTVAALAGTILAIRRAVRLPPAEAMRPEPPARYRETPLERLGLKRFFSQPTRMIVRSIARRPWKAALSVTGIALACAILVVAFFLWDAIDHMVRVQYGLAQREDLTVVLVEPTSFRALYELESLDGVTHGEAFRTVPARLRFAHRTYRTSIQGIQPDGDLFRLLDVRLRPIAPPVEGVVLTEYLGRLLGVRPGDLLTVEVLEGSRPVRQVRVAALVEQYIGVSAFMSRPALNRLLREGDAVSGAYLAVDARRQPEVYRALDQMPRVAATAVHEKVIRNFYDTMAESMLGFAFFTSLFAGIVAFGVVYNSARISLSERGRELASLRVLGLTRGEIAYILLGELAALTLAAVPLGFVIGHGFCAYMTAAMQTDLFRIPLIVQPRTYAIAATVVLASGVISGLVVRGRLNRLDLVAVLKTRE